MNVISFIFNNLILVFLAWVVIKVFENLLNHIIDDFYDLWLRAYVIEVIEKMDLRKQFCKLKEKFEILKRAISFFIGTGMALFNKIFKRK
jgi:hypothetical protein